MKRIFKVLVFLFVFSFLTSGLFAANNTSSTCYNYSTNYGSCTSNFTQCGGWNNGVRSCEGTQRITYTITSTYNCDRANVVPSNTYVSCQVTQRATQPEGYIEFYRLVNGRTAEKINLRFDSDLLERNDFDRAYARDIGNKIVNEGFINEYIKDDIRVVFTCSSNDCRNNRVTKDFTENGSGSLTLEGRNGLTTTVNFRIWKIDKIPPVGEIVYTDEKGVKIDADKWTSANVTVNLEGKDIPAESWLDMANSNISYICKSETCKGTLHIEDSAGNRLYKDYEFTKIDKTPPQINVRIPQEVKDNKQQVYLTCKPETRGSGCEIEGEFYLGEFPTGTVQKFCVKDKAGNEGCYTVAMAKSGISYSDLGMPWTNKDRELWLNCNDVAAPGEIASGCVKDKVTDTVENNTEEVYLTIRDWAGNSLERGFQIARIDKTLPNLFVEGLTEFKASPGDKLTISADDKLNGVEQSGVEKITYSWGESCISGDNITGTTIENNSGINYTVAGTHTLYICAKDVAGNIKEMSKSIIIHPGDLNQQNTKLSVSSNGDKYPNDKDYYLYTLSLRDQYDNPITGKSLTLVEHDLTSLTGGLKGINVDSGKSALTVFDYNAASNDKGETTFKLKSIAPGTFSQGFKIQMYGWNDNYVDDRGIVQTIYPIINQDNLFKKPISIESIVVSTVETSSGELCSSDTVWEGKPEMIAPVKYKIILNNEGKLDSVSNGSLNISIDTVKSNVEGHKWLNDKITDVVYDFGGNINACLGFKGQLSAKSNILKAPVVKNEDLKISYVFRGERITYVLDESEIEGCDIPTLGIKVEGSLQGDGKSQLTGQESNFSDISMSEMRGTIRRNAYGLVTNMSNGQILNGIRYVEGDVTIGGVISGYETLIVRNGNILINQDLSVPNATTKPLGIIVLKDNYNVNVDFEVNGISSESSQGKGNIFVANNVKQINAIIYADGTFRSAKDYIGTGYGDSELTERLVLNGTLFTRNTIGGATELVMEELGNNGEYLLPGGRKIEGDYELASYYDLNFVRKVSFCEGDPESYAFLISYDARVQTNPPKGFTSN